MNNYQYLKEENKVEIDFGYIITISLFSAGLWTFLIWLVGSVIMHKKTEEFACFLTCFLGSATFSFFCEFFRVRRLKRELGI